MCVCVCVRLWELLVSLYSLAGVHFNLLTLSMEGHVTQTTLPKTDRQRREDEGRLKLDDSKTEAERKTLKVRQIWHKRGSEM